MTLVDNFAQPNTSVAEPFPLCLERPLGAVVAQSGTQFALWAPSAQKVTLRLFSRGSMGESGDALIGQYTMRPESDGSWTYDFADNKHGVYYDFLIERDCGSVDRVADPWARGAGVNGRRSMVVDFSRTNPDGWYRDHMPDVPLAQTVVWETHVGDFSNDPAGGFPESHRGKYLAFTDDGTSLDGHPDFPTGIAYLKKLGVTAVQLMPIYDFGSVDEETCDRYNWGYDPVNYNVPEGSYSTNPFDGSVRIREVKQMVQALHNAGIKVIMDVVYNHMFSPDNWFERSVPDYFLRRKPNGALANGSGCGCDMATERKMFRRFIVESVTFWAREYHMDGFRFDLMGIHDIETMNRLRSELLEIDPTIFVYGEGWVAADSPLPFEQRAVKENVGQMEGIGVFNDEFRDGLKGSTFDEQEPGYASGNINGHFEPVKYGIVGGTDHPQVDYGGLLYCNAPYAGAPSQMINFVSCHDGYTLVDKLKLSVQGDHAADELIPIDKLVHTVLLTAQGIPFIRSGEEIMQDKQGEPNSYKSPDSINRIDWSLKAKNREVFDFIRGLIALRKAHPAFRIPTVEGLQQWLRFMDTGDSGVIAYTLGEYANNDEWKEILVAYNGNRHEAEIGIPEGEWNVVCRNGQIDPEGKDRLPGGSVKIAASSALILYRQ